MESSCMDELVDGVPFGHPSRSYREGMFSR